MTPRLPHMFLACLLSSTALAADYATLVPSTCIHGMGEWGEEAVHDCIRRELPAAQALEAYPASSQPVIERCIGVAGRGGWVAIKECTDRALARP